jgi:adenosine/AMP kinase
VLLLRRRKYTRGLQIYRARGDQLVNVRGDGRDSRRGARRRYLRISWYFGTLVQMDDDFRLEIERVQTGVRMEKRILKVLKAFAEYHDMTLGDVLEGIVLHAFDGKTPFSPASLEKIRELKKFYELDLDSRASHRLKEIRAESSRKRKEGA